jgi:type VI secretion system protein ImpK
MQDPNDPFGGPDDDDRTIIRPNPGRRSGQHPDPPRSQPSFTPGPAIDPSDFAGLNPLEKAASLLLNLLGQIRNTAAHPDPSALHRQFAHEIKQFESRAQKWGVSSEMVFTARYVLCTTIDEFVLSTPWGATSIWRNQSLLRLLHQETSGGDKFFLLLNKLIQDPAKHTDLLELMYLCLSLGFQGRYRIEDGGTAKLEAIRENLYQTIRNFRGDPEEELSPHWEGVNKALEHTTVRIPMWALATIVLALLAIVFVAFTFNLSRHTDPLYASLGTVGSEDNLLPARSLSPPPLRRIEDPAPERFSLRKFLTAEIARNEVTVDELPDRIIVLINGDGLFDSGVDTIKSEYRAILEKIGEGVEQTKGRIEVSGHSDNVPISKRSRFPSNRALSQARADEVVRVLAQRVSERNRLTSLGLADSKPIASNSTAEGRAQNRRVEITVFERSRDN